MRWWLLLLLLPVAQAQVTTAHADAHEPLLFDEAEVRFDAGATCGQPTVLLDGPHLHFEDDATGTQCARVILRHRPPQVDGDFRVHFDAARDLDSSAAPATLPARATQEFTVTSRGANLTATIFAPETGDAARQTVALPSFPSDEVVELSWFFSDDGATGDRDLPSLGSGHAFSADIWTSRIQYPRLALPLEDGGLVLPAAPLEVDSLSLRLAPGSRAVTITGADGPVPFTRDGDLLTIDGGDLRGTTRLQVDVAAAIVPQPITALPALLAGAMLTAGVVATLRAHRFQRVQGQVHGVRAISLRALAIATSIFAAISTLVAFVFARQDIAYVPLSALGWSFYGQWLALSVVLAIILILANRQRIQAIEADLAARERQARQLQRSNQELEEFAIVASHDLQEPLRKIAGFSRLLVAEPDSPQAPEYAQYIESNTQRMERLVQALLRYSTLDGGVDRVPIDLERLVRDVVTDIQGDLDAVGGSVHVRALPPVQGAPELLRQVFANLLTNSIKYRHPERAPDIHVTAKTTPAGVHVTVADNGRGIPAGMEAKVLQMFRRVHRDDRGTGIGLALCDRIVHLHGGRLWIESQDGTQVHFTIPETD